MFVVYALCSTCKNEEEIASFDNERDAAEYAAAQNQKRKNFALRIQEE